MIDRYSVKDAQKIVESFLPDRNIRDALIKFLVDSIIYADSLDYTNWSLNLDKKGNFIRFNVGQVYCITIYPNDSLILCIKSRLKENIGNKKLNIDFAGYANKKEIRTKELDKTPNCLIKVPESVGCYIKHKHILDYLNVIKRANKDFITYSTKKTTILPKMKQAHSTGIIEYISSISKKKLPNPLYSIIEKEFYQLQEKLLIKAKKMTDLELEKEILKRTRISQKIKVSSIQYVRNPFVSELAKRKAKGICQDCKQAAPFINKKTKEPYLESHHIKPLSDG